MSLFAIGIAPYLAAALLVRFASLAFPRLREWEDGTPFEQGKIVVGTRILALVLVTPQAYGLALGLERFAGSTGPIVPNPGAAYQMVVVATLIASTAIIMWLADQITRRGVGNGIALILFADMVSDLPSTLAGFVELTRTGAIPFSTLIGLIVFSIALVALLVVTQHGVSFAVVRFPQQQVGSRTLAARQATLPLPLITGGLVSAMLALWLLSTALYLIGVIVFDGDGYVIEGWVAWAWYGHPARLAVLAILIVAIAYLYSLAVIRPKKAAGFLESKGAGLFGAPPGHKTERMLRRVLFRLAIIGGSVLALVYMLPEILLRVLPQLPGTIGGVGFLITVAVSMDFLREGAHRLHRRGGGGKPSENMSIAMGPEIRSRISEAGR